MVSGLPYAQKKLKLLGHKITLVVNKKDLKFGTKALEYASQSLILSDNDDFLKIIQALHAADPFDGVISFAEGGLLQAAQCAELLKLPGMQIQAVTNTLDKYLFRCCLNTIPECNIEFKLCRNEEEVVEFYNKQQNKHLVLKPVSGMGSKGVISVMDKKEIQKAFRYSSNNYSTPVLAESYVEGDDFSVETFTNHGNHQLIAITDKYNTGPPNFVGKYHVMPSKIDDKKRDFIFNKVAKVLDVLNVKFGLAHTEIKVLNREVKIIEIQLRPGGKFYHLIENGLGIDIFELTINSMFNLNYQPKQGIGSASIYYFDANEEGVVEKIEGIEQVAKNTNVCDINIRVKPGCFIQKWTDTSDRLGHIVCTDVDSHSSLQAAMFLANQIKFVIKQEKGV